MENEHRWNLLPMRLRHSGWKMKPRGKFMTQTRGLPGAGTWVAVDCVVDGR
jgi:hypothetical protein